MMHVAEVDHTGDLARLRPWGTYQNVVVVGVAVNDTAAQTRQPRYHFGFVKCEKSFNQRAVLRAFNFRDVFFDPRGARGIPFEFAMCGGMLERLHAGVYLAKELAQIAKNFRGVRANSCENAAP